VGHQPQAVKTKEHRAVAEGREVLRQSSTPGGSGSRFHGANLPPAHLSALQFRAGSGPRGRPAPGPRSQSRTAAATVLRFAPPAQRRDGDARAPHGIDDAARNWRIEPSNGATLRLGATLVPRRRRKRHRGVGQAAQSGSAGTLRGQVHEGCVPPGGVDPVDQRCCLRPRSPCLDVRAGAGHHPRTLVSSRDRRPVETRHGGAGAARPGARQIPGSDGTTRRAATMTPWPVHSAAIVAKPSPFQARSASASGRPARRPVSGYCQERSVAGDTGPLAFAGASLGTDPSDGIGAPGKAAPPARTRMKPECAVSPLPPGLGPARPTVHAGHPVPRAGSGVRQGGSPGLALLDGLGLDHALLIAFDQHEAHRAMVSESDGGR